MDFDIARQHLISRQDATDVLDTNPGQRTHSLYTPTRAAWHKTKHKGSALLRGRVRLGLCVSNRPRWPEPGVVLSVKLVRAPKHGAKGKVCTDDGSAAFHYTTKSDSAQRKRQATGTADATRPFRHQPVGLLASPEIVASITKKVMMAYSWPHSAGEDDPGRWISATF